MTTSQTEGPREMNLVHPNDRSDFFIFSFKDFLRAQLSISKEEHKRDMRKKINKNKIKSNGSLVYGPLNVINLSTCALANALLSDI